MDSILEELGEDYFHDEVHALCNDGGDSDDCEASDSDADDDDQVASDFAAVVDEEEDSDDDDQVGKDVAAVAENDGQADAERQPTKIVIFPLSEKQAEKVNMFDTTTDHMQQVVSSS